MRHQESASWRTKVAEKNAFGKLLSTYLARAGMSQEEFADQMVSNGYPDRYKRGMVSFSMYHPGRLYGRFFYIAQQVLELSDEERNALVEAWQRSWD